MRLVSMVAAITAPILTGCALSHASVSEPEARLGTGWSAELVVLRGVGIAMVDGSQYVAELTTDTAMFVTAGDNLSLEFPAHNSWLQRRGEEQLVGAGFAFAADQDGVLWEIPLHQFTGSDSLFMDSASNIRLRNVTACSAELGEVCTVFPLLSRVN